MAINRSKALRKRHLRVRRKISGTSGRPRLCLHKSLKHLYAQIIDDAQGRTLCFATTNTKTNKAQTKNFSNIPWAEKLGQQIASLAGEAGLNNVIFDRGGYRYHGVVKAFAESARKAGLKF